MAAAYCSTFGGTGTLVGTGTNLTFKGIYENTFPESGGVNFTQWMFASIPQMIVNTALTWLYLRIMFMGFLRPGSKDAELSNIGPEGEAVTNRVTILFINNYRNLFSFSSLLIYCLGCTAKIQRIG